MYIAIDDTYGPEITSESKYVTGKRRTHVAVMFEDSEVDFLREQMRGLLRQIEEEENVKASEFHFVDVYNKKGVWSQLEGSTNLDVFLFFAGIYKRYRWPVVVQTVDDRTMLEKSCYSMQAKIDGLDTKKREDLCLLMLLIKIKNRFRDSNNIPSVNLIVDEGRKKAGTRFGYEIFGDWPNFSGQYASSAQDPLLQIADFVAYCINRSTHLALKKTISNIDFAFLNMVAEMNINSDDIKTSVFDRDEPLVDHLDRQHKLDREKKGFKN